MDNEVHIVDHKGGKAVMILMAYNPRPSSSGKSVLLGTIGNARGVAVKLPDGSVATVDVSATVYRDPIGAAEVDACHQAKLRKAEADALKAAGRPKAAAAVAAGQLAPALTTPATIPTIPG